MACVRVMCCATVKTSSLVGALSPSQLSSVFATCWPIPVYLVCLLSALLREHVSLFYPCLWFCLWGCRALKGLALGSFRGVFALTLAPANGGSRSPAAQWTCLVSVKEKRITAHLIGTPTAGRCLLLFVCSCVGCRVSFYIYILKPGPC